METWLVAGNKTGRRMSREGGRKNEKKRERG